MEGRLYLGLQFQRESPHGGEAWQQAADHEAERSNLQEQKKQKTKNKAGKTKWKKDRQGYKL